MSGAPALDWQRVGPWREVIERGATLIFLGLGDGGPRFAVDATGADIGPDSAREAFDARTLAPLLPGGEAAILAEARSLIDWHARHRFCAQCGSPTRVELAGWVRRCPECRASHFPRTDPVVIMLSVRGEYGLLGRNQRRAGNRFSCLAGFMEPGETFEEAVRRETFEEAGIRVGRVQLSGVSALAVSVEPDDRVRVRGADRGDHGRSGRDCRGALVLAGRDPRDGRARRDRSRRPDTGFAAGPGRDRASHLPPLVEWAGRYLTIPPDDPFRPAKTHRARRGGDDDRMSDALSYNRIFPRIALLVVIVVSAAGCGRDKAQVTAGQTLSAEAVKEKCADQQWREKNLGIWYAVCRQPASW